MTLETELGTRAGRALRTARRERRRAQDTGQHTAQVTAALTTLAAETEVENQQATDTSYAQAQDNSELGDHRSRADVEVLEVQLMVLTAALKDERDQRQSLEEQLDN